MPLSRLPRHLLAYSDPYVGLLVDDLGLLQLVTATSALPRSTERYLQRQRRRARLICAVRVRHAPAVPGRYVPRPPSGDVDLQDPPWTELWPGDVPGTVELDPARAHLRLRIDRPDAPLELDYRLTNATFSHCDVTTNGPPDALVVIAMLLWRRRRSSRGSTSATTSVPAAQDPTGGRQHADPGRMTSTRVLALLSLASACTPPRPLSEAILGEWEELCRTDREAAATCLGRDKPDLYKRFLPGGEVVIGAHSGISMTGTWTLQADILVASLGRGDMHVEEMYRARIEDDRLVLWDVSQGFGVVHGRAGAPFVAAPTRRSSADSTAHAIGGVGYRLALPADYALTRDDDRRQRWSPVGGSGLTVQLTLAPRTRALVDGSFVTPPCEPDTGGVSSETTEIDGVRRVVWFGLSRCLDDSDEGLACRVEHTRGYLDDSEEEAARALCASLETTRT